MIDKEGHTVHLEVYGIDKITADIPTIDQNAVQQLFKDVPNAGIDRPVVEVDVLIGFNYANFHPQREQSVEHLLLLKNRFGRCIGGTHPKVKEDTKHHELNNIQFLREVSPSVEDFYKIENLGIAMWRMQMRKMSAWQQKLHPKRRKGTCPYRKKPKL